MTELLAPAGNMEALKAAVSNGCDAVYLGMQKFGARAYSNNFDEETIIEAVDYAHLRNVKIYVTMNTIVFEDEIPEMKAQLDFLYGIGVDGIIIQDLAVLEYVVNNCPGMEAHCSTQMGIDDLDGTQLLKEKGAMRVVLAREVGVDKCLEIRREADIPIEVFIHGALCVSYSGNCLMSGLIGYRSGNRGRCVGSCRKPYSLVETDTGRLIDENYILSTKDLNTIDHIDQLKKLDSLKIEGRMKEPVYITNVVSKYRKAIDGEITPQDKTDLLKTFNRTYTCGYIFGEDKKDITNVDRPNHYGYEIGEVSGFYAGKYQITLTEPLRQNDIIRIDSAGEDIIYSANRLYDANDNLINGAEKQVYIRLKESLRKGSKVYKTKDFQYYKELENAAEGEFRKFDLDLDIYAYPGSKLTINAEGLGLSYLYESEEILEEAINAPTSYEQVSRQFSKLGDTVFKPGRITYEESGAFMSAKMMNAARRDIVAGLYEARKAKSRRQPADKAAEIRDKIAFEPAEPVLTASVTTKEQYDACVKAGISEIYFDNIVRRNENEYQDMDGQLLIGGYGGVHHYKDSNPFITDYSFNVVNAESCYQLYKLGAKRVTLSYELNKTQLKDLISSYETANGGSPALEMIVYGHAPLMFTKYCPLKKMGLCGLCKKHTYELRDEHGSFPILSHDDCTTTILNGKILNLLDEMPYIDGVQAFRLNFTIESADEVAQIISSAKGKLNGELTESLFNQKTDTRGHFNKEIL